MSEFIKPTVHLIAYTMVDEQEIRRYIDSIDAGSWDTDAKTDAEYLIEVAGRLCYASWTAGGQNRNITRVREGNKSYIDNIIKSKHGSCVEHASCTFIFANVSRVFCAELARHRAGCAVSEASLRFIRLDQLKAFEPAILEETVGPEHFDYFLSRLELMEKWQVEMAEMFDLDNKSFEDKKKITSAMRRLAPLGLSTNIMWTANIRALRHVLELRTSIHAEEEIRKIMDQVGYILQEKYPVLFGDFTRNADAEWITPNSKI